MIELGGIVIVLVCLYIGICDFLGSLDDIAEGMNKNSRVGESPLDRQLRAKRRRWYRLAFVCSIILTVIGLYVSFVIKR